jgi:hypothetical protein
MKKIVSHFKHTGLQSHLNHTLKSMSETRWNTLYIMAESILSEYDIKVLNERNEIHIYSLDKNLLDGVT